MTVWSLTTDTDMGLDTALYLTEEQAWEALAAFWFPADEDTANREALLAAIAVGTKEAAEWFDAFRDAEGTSDWALITRHDHPWVFEAEDAGKASVRDQIQYEYTKEAREQRMGRLIGVGTAPKDAAGRVASFTSSELATVLHGLRMIQENANGPADCVAGVCGHFHESDALTDDEIDALCERLNAGGPSELSIPKD